MVVSFVIIIIAILLFAERIIQEQANQISELNARISALNESIARQGGHVFISPNQTVEGVKSPGWYDDKEQ